MSALSKHAYAAALAGLPQLAPGRLRTLLERHDPELVWTETVAGCLNRLLPVPSTPDQSQQLHLMARHAAAEASRIDPAFVWAQCVDLGVAITLLGEDGYPTALAADRAAPAVLFHQGA
ncbi:MAG TPA: hypothetical protein VF855_01260 [Acidimicrobiales bacterium]